jgi:hypothetical protein
MDRTKRIAARAPDLDIFSQAFVVRERTGWQITAAGRDFLATIEKPATSMAPPIEAVRAMADPPVAAPPKPLIVIYTRRAAIDIPQLRLSREAPARRAHHGHFVALAVQALKRPASGPASSCC